MSNNAVSLNAKQARHIPIAVINYHRLCSYGRSPLLQLFINSWLEYRLKMPMVLHHLSIIVLFLSENSSYLCSFAKVLSSLKLKILCLCWVKYAFQLNAIAHKLQYGLRFWLKQTRLYTHLRIIHVYPPVAVASIKLS